MKLSQYSYFDPNIEKLVCEELLSEYSETSEYTFEDFGEIMDGFDFAQLCQRNDGSYYGIAAGKQCRIGRPAARAGAKGGDKDPSQRIDKNFLKRATTQKLAEYINDRRLYGYQRKAIEAELLRREGAIAKSAVANDKPSQRLGKKQLENFPTEKLQEYLDNRKLFPYQRQALENEIQKRQKSKEASLQLPGSNTIREMEQEIAAELAKKPYGLDSDVAVRVNKKLLEQDTTVLQQILRERSLNTKQRDKIEEEVVGRGKTPDSGQVFRRGQKKTPAESWTTIEGVKGYNAEDVFFQKDNKKLGSGAMGTVLETKGPPPGVIKNGQIGEFEADAWQMLQGTNRVPEFHGAKISSQTKRVGPGLGGHVKEGDGFIGFGKAGGVPLQNVVGPSPAIEREIVNEYIRARRDIHSRGVAHNDMHRGNVFWDRDQNRVQLVDFGLAQTSYKAALVEALCTLGGGDFQADRFFNQYTVKTVEYDTLQRNIKRAEGFLRRRNIQTQNIHREGIRSSANTLEQILPGVTEDQAKAFIDLIYEGI